MSASKASPEFWQVEKFVEKAPTRLLPPGWRNWPRAIPPSNHKLPIDKELERLQKERKLILPASQGKDRDTSHEIEIRLQLVWYAKMEFLNTRAVAASVLASYENHRKLLRSANDSLSNFLKLIPGAEAEQFSNAKAALELVQKLRKWIDICARSGGRPTEHWKRLFVVRLAAFWHVATGKQPSISPDTDFARLVYAAWNSLHPNIPEINLDSFVRRYAQSVSREEALDSASLARFGGYKIW
jgi:hypothetical protein